MVTKFKDKDYSQKQIEFIDNQSTASDKQYDVIDNNYDESKKLATDVKRTAQKIVIDNYSQGKPFVTYSLVLASIVTKINRLDKYAETNFNKNASNTNKYTNTFYKEKYSKKELSSLKTKRAIMLAEMNIRNEQLKNEIKTILTNNIGRGMSYTETVRQIGQLYPAYESQAATIVRTYYQRTFRDSVYAKSINLFDKFLYQGPQDSKNRTYCANHVNKIYTKEEAEQIQAVIMGFYNCRHQLVGVPNAQ